jgi:hypothetical protein
MASAILTALWRIQVNSVTITDTLTDTIKKWIQRIKWIALCQKCGMNPDSLDFETGMFREVTLSCKKCNALRYPVLGIIVNNSECEHDWKRDIYE